MGGWEDGRMGVVPRSRVASDGTGKSRGADGKAGQGSAGQVGYRHVCGHEFGISLTQLKRAGP